jgi:hypothetical protein
MANSAHWKTGRSGQGRFLETVWTELFIEELQGIIKKLDGYSDF